MELLIELSKVTFKVVSTVILDLFNEKLFHTDIKPQNIVMQFNEQKTKLIRESNKGNSEAFDIKLIDFASTS